MTKDEEDVLKLPYLDKDNYKDWDRVAKRVLRIKELWENAETKIPEAAGR